MTTKKPNYQAARLAGVKPSAITSIAEIARQQKADGRPVCNLSVGEPDFHTAPEICGAAVAAMQRGETTYPRTQGTLELIDAIRARVKSDCGVDLTGEQITVANGAKQILFNAFFATLNAGDEVIIPAPYWTTYPDIVRLCGGKVVHTPVQASGGFQPDVQAIQDAITPRTRWILLNTPSNPSGDVISEKTMSQIFELLRRHPDIMLMCDEIYDKVVFDGVAFQSVLAMAPELADQILVVNGVSKTYAMTGWRVGYGLGPKPLIRSMTDVQGQSTSGACSISQAASATALSMPQEGVIQRREIYQSRRDVLVTAINAIPGLNCPSPAGAFYVLFSIERLIGLSHPVSGPITDGISFCKALISEAEVAAVPGEAFGCPDHVRFSYACEIEEISEAVRKMALFVGQLK